MENNNDVNSQEENTSLNNGNKSVSNQPETAQDKKSDSSKAGEDIVRDQNPYDSENLDHESNPESKDITEQDIEKDLKENDLFEDISSKGPEIDNLDRSESDSGSFDIHEVESTPIHEKEFEIGELSNEEIKNDELNKNEINPVKPDSREP